MKILGYLFIPWAVVMGIIEVLVAYLCFDTFRSPFETVSLAIIGTIYLKVKSGTDGVKDVAGLWHSQSEFVKIRKLLNDSTIDEEEVQEAESLVKSQIVQGYIHMVFGWGIGVMILWNLFRVLG